jgi:hypothetical protein
MNRIYITSYEGRIFFAEPDSNSFELLQTSNINDSINGVKKLSSSDWCLWAISGQLKLKLFVFKQETPYEHQEITYENQVRMK